MIKAVLLMVFGAVAYFIILLIIAVNYNKHNRRRK